MAKAPNGHPKPAAECLSANEVGDYMSPGRDMLMASERVAEIQRHLGICEECLRNVKFWESIKEQSKNQDGQAASE